MANETIIQNLIFQLGQSQLDRFAPELDIHFADVDERTSQNFLQFAQKFAAFVHYYRDNPATPAGNWSHFFPDDAIAALLKPDSPDAANVTPHLALFLAFLELYKTPQEVLNRITGRHLDFYYKDVLQLPKKAATPDKVHVLIELKKNVAPIRITPEHLFSAGKDATGVELLYTPTRETVINSSQIASLRSLLLDNGMLRYAPIANSADGLGAELSGEQPKWSGFGHAKLPVAEVGFAIAAPVLRMKAGSRTITVQLTLSLSEGDRQRLNSSPLEQSFDVFLTGEKTWLGPYKMAPQMQSKQPFGWIQPNNQLEFTVTVPASEKAIVDYNSAIHGYAYTAQAPVMQLLLKQEESDLSYEDFTRILILKAQVLVDVAQVTDLNLENDIGSLNASKAFLPFGTQPTPGSRLLVGYAEALTKNLIEVSLSLQWKDTPSDFSQHYAGYGIVDPKANPKSKTSNTIPFPTNFTANISLKDGRGQMFSQSQVSLFEANPASRKTITLTQDRSNPALEITTGMVVYALYATRSRWGRKLADQFVLKQPVLKPAKTVAPEVQEGFITLVLNQGFGHEVYRKKYVEQVMQYSKSGTGDPNLINEPYTPTMQSLTLSYRAESDVVDIASPSLTEFANRDLEFFHITYFGQMREHGYQRLQFQQTVDAAIATTVTLLPAHPYRGELLVGLRQLHPGDSVSVLFQVAEGSADPKLNQATIDWFVLCDHYWKRLSQTEVLLDTTNHLLTSGTIQFVIPLQATTDHTILPTGHIWLKAAISGPIEAVCQLIEVSANAVEAQFLEQGNDPQHLLAALPQGKITKLKTGLATVKSIKQPYASFGGSAIERDAIFYTRVSERLRHKNRCITAWDYERMILEAFPKIHKVKCIPHAKEDVWLAPGHVLLVVVPDLKNQYAVDRLRPQVDANTLSRIKDYVQKHVGMQVQVQVKNPNYQSVQLDFRVKFYPGQEFNASSLRLQQDIIQFLSPWAYATEQEPTFGSKLYKSVLLDFVEDLPYVDYVTDFKLYSISSSDEIRSKIRSDVNQVQPARPDAILVSADSHIIHPAL